jgi:hypothetical protein
MTFTRVPLPEYELWLDDGKRAVWSDRSLVTVEQINTVHDGDMIAAAIRAAGGTVRDGTTQTDVVPLGDLSDAAAECDECKRAERHPEDGPCSTHGKLLFGCSTCQCTDIECTAWVTYNGSEVLGCEPPSDDIWCPECDRTCDIVVVDKLKPHRESQLPVEPTDPIDKARFK